MKPVRSNPNPLLVRTSWATEIQRPNLWYRFMRRVFQTCSMMGVKARVFDRHFEPASGGVVYVSNHQSFFDPVLVAFALKRPMNFMARDSLFKNRPFGFLIESLNAFPIRRETADTRSLKEAMRRLKDGRQITVFPEGTRTRDGSIGRFLPGIAVLCRRAAEWTVPVVIDGAFDVWPKSSILPKLTGRIAIQYGAPIHRDDIQDRDAKEFVIQLRERVVALQCALRRRLGLPVFDYDD
jgi:1-acyl-sn-glycerol-3-phosphate acyltransferase